LEKGECVKKNGSGGFIFWKTVKRGRSSSMKRYLRHGRGGLRREEIFVTGRRGWGGSQVKDYGKDHASLKGLLSSGRE